MGRLGWRVGGTVGNIAPGKAADLFICDCDPLRDITTLDRVTAVMKGGALYANLKALREREPLLP